MVRCSLVFLLSEALLRWTYLIVFYLSGTSTIFFQALPGRIFDPSLDEVADAAL